MRNVQVIKYVTIKGFKKNYVNDRWGSYRVLSSLTGSYLDLPGLTGSYLVLLGPNGSYRVLSGLIGSYRSYQVLLCLSWSYPVLPGKISFLCYKIDLPCVTWNIIKLLGQSSSFHYTQNFNNTFLKDVQNPAYGKHWISRPMQKEAPTPKGQICFSLFYLYIFFWGGATFFSFLFLG